MCHRGICASDKDSVVMMKLGPILAPLVKAYLKLYVGTHQEKDFFGLRDFYRYVSLHNIIQIWTCDEGKRSFMDLSQQY